MNIRGEGYRADCAKCVGSKFTCDEHYAIERAKRGQDRGKSIHMADNIPTRASYEGVGGWKDGRFGQAYDLIADAFKERGECMFEWRRHPLLRAIEEEDGNHE